MSRAWVCIARASSVKHVLPEAYDCRKRWSEHKPERLALASLLSPAILDMLVIDHNTNHCAKAVGRLRHVMHISTVLGGQLTTIKDYCCQSIRGGGAF